MELSVHISFSYCCNAHVIVVFSCFFSTHVKHKRTLVALIFSICLFVAIIVSLCPFIFGWLMNAWYVTMICGVVFCSIFNVHICSRSWNVGAQNIEFFFLSIRIIFHKWNDKCVLRIIFIHFCFIFKELFSPPPASFSSPFNRIRVHARILMAIKLMRDMNMNIFPLNSVDTIQIRTLGGWHLYSFLMIFCDDELYLVLWKKIC